MAYEDGFCQEGAGESDEPQLHLDSNLLFLHGYLVSFERRLNKKEFRPSISATQRPCRVVMRAASLYQAKSVPTKVCTNQGLLFNCF